MIYLDQALVKDIHWIGDNGVLKVDIDVYSALCDRMDKTIEITSPRTGVMLDFLIQSWNVVNLRLVHVGGPNKFVIAIENK